MNAPTLIINVETFANVPTIINKRRLVAGIGTEKSKGPRSLTDRQGPQFADRSAHGTTLRTIVEVWSGGPTAARSRRQTGGPSGGCIPAEHLDTPVDYESLTQLGSIMGSGGMIVMDQTTNMVEVARFFMDFCREESCGKCIPCRAGTVQMHSLLSRIAERRATAAELDQLVQLCHMVQATSLCGLGQTAPNPVLSTLRYFRQEYEALLQPATNGNGTMPLPVV